jgi:hypothetical protein
MTSSNRTSISSPVAGLTVYDTDSNRYFYFNGTAWRSMAINTNLPSGGGSNWTLSGTTLSPTVSGRMVNASDSFGIGGTRFIRTGSSGTSIYMGQNSGRISTGFNNTFAGYQSGFKNTSGFLNTAIGFQALFSNTTGNNNIATGESTLYSNTTGNNNTANGVNALYSNTTGNNNTASGFQALYLNKKLMVIPLKGQYEQLCNAEALKDFHVKVINDLGENFKQS